MSETDAAGGPRRRLGAPSDPFGARLYAISEGLAVLGGLILVVVTAFTVISVAGRTGFDTPVLGDQEIVELGCAAAIFAFMPNCQMRAANVIVDFFTAPLPLAVRDALDATMNAVFSLCIIVVTWRLALGGIGKFESQEETMFLRLELWWGYVIAFVACALWSAACLYSVVRSLRFMVQARRAARGRGDAS
jgi:TRAP-type C4-dicarboxylate transport system permease small subunit